MTTPTLDPVLADSIEAELASLGTKGSRLQRHQRRVRGVSATAAGIVIAGALTAAAAVISGLPGETTVTPLRGGLVSGIHTGTATVNLGPVPQAASTTDLSITCTSGGNMSVPLTGGGNVGDAVSWNCSDPLKKPTIHITDGALPTKGKTEITITAAPGTVWKFTAQYASRTTTPWGVNAKGETYGAPNFNGTPDLSATQATNGKQGYTRASEFRNAKDGSYINVYAADGTTVIGKFYIGNGN